jgi:hypothetical protein
MNSVISQELRRDTQLQSDAVLQGSCVDEYRFIDNYQDHSLPAVTVAREAAAQS